MEQQNGSSYTEILYGPTGKLALMNGQSVVKAFILLPAGATAVYTSGPTYRNSSENTRDVSPNLVLNT